MIELAIIAGVSAILFSVYLAFYIKKQNLGTEKMREIYLAIKEGSKAYLKRQFKTVGMISAVLMVVLYLAFDLGRFPFTSLAFILGVLCSFTAGYLSMEVATEANSRTAYASLSSLDRTLKIAFYGGMVMGLFNVGLSLLGVTALFLLFGGNPNLIVGYGFGASFAALFAQLGGGIYTKAADIGADLVGKVEAGIPEDDPRNPAVIADNVGDNVGDVAGRGADLFESMSGENIAAMLIGFVLYTYTNNFFFVIFPLLARAVGIFATILGVPIVRGREGEFDPFTPLRNAAILTAILGSVGFYFLVVNTIKSIHLFFAGLTGIVASFFIIVITDYYTSRNYRPVLSIAESSKTGAATNILTGYAVGLESTAFPVITIAAALLISYYFGLNFAETVGISKHLGGVYGTGIATMGMLSIAGIILGLDGFGPIVDNAAGIIEMSGIEDEKSKRIERFDAVGNTTKALTKGYAMAAAGIAALLLFQAYLEVAGISQVNLIIPEIIVGLFIGALVPFLFTSFAIKAVSKAAFRIIEEVRRQFREIKGLMEGKAKPNYSRCVDICTIAAQKGMIIPGMVALLTPILLGIILGVYAVGAFLIGAIISGYILAMQMNTGGAAWDNAKKYIEEGNLGGKGSEAHKAAVIGDTIGDPFKDTAGPSLNILIKLMSTISLVFVPLFLLLHP